MPATIVTRRTAEDLAQQVAVPRAQVNTVTKRLEFGEAAQLRTRINGSVAQPILGT